MCAFTLKNSYASGGYVKFNYTQYMHSLIILPLMYFIISMVKECSKGEHEALTLIVTNIYKDRLFFLPKQNF